jgi:hypothetical protein
MNLVNITKVFDIEIELAFSLKFNFFYFNFFLKFLYRFDILILKINFKK